MQQYIDISPYCDILGMILYQYTINTHFSCINTSNIMIYQCINIKIVYIYIQYFMTDAAVVCYGCYFYSSATTYVYVFNSYNFGKKFCPFNQLIHTLLYCTMYRCIVIQSSNISIYPNYVSLYLYLVCTYDKLINI